MDRSHFQNMQEKSGRFNNVLESWCGRLRNKVEALTQTFNRRSPNEKQDDTELPLRSAGGEPRCQKGKEDTD